MNLAPPVNSLNRILFSLFKSFPNIETFEKCSFLFEFKEGENFNHPSTIADLRGRQEYIEYFKDYNLSLTKKLGKKGVFQRSLSYFESKYLIKRLEAFLGKYRNEHFSIKYLSP